MDGRINPFVGEQEDYENSPENSEESPPSGMFNDSKMTSTSSPRRSRRSVQKRVVSVPIKDVEGSRLKGEMSTPPSDSWAWRKYGQKPIKGSPYPRGYYRCSSSKGCPARKQVERSRADPTMLMVTYSCEHNHPWPTTKNNHNRDNNNNNNNSNKNQDVTTSTEATTSTSPPTIVTTPTNEEEEQKPTIFATDEKFNNLIEGSLISEFGWFMDLDSNSSTLMLESPFLARDYIGDADVATIFSTREDDESLFADLGELPECSMVFRRGMAGREEEHRRCSLTPLCRTTG